MYKSPRVVEPSSLKASKKSLGKHLWGTDSVCWSCLGAERWSTWSPEVPSNPVFNISFFKTPAADSSHLLHCWYSRIVSHTSVFWDLQTKSHSQKSIQKKLQGLNSKFPVSEIVTTVVSWLYLSCQSSMERKNKLLHSPSQHLETSR